MKNIFLFLAIIFSQYSFGQSVIIDQAKIEFERTINVWANLPEGDFAAQMKKNIPQYQTSFFTFESDGKKSLYSPVQNKEAESRRGFMMASPASDNIVFSNYENKTTVSQKNVSEKTYLIDDSLRKAKWKITNDFREIAGFNCRRATTIIMDSVFVVAFYTDEIMIPGGPESFNGLPGMIMGLVINRLHTTWYATKVSVTGVNTASIIAPKGKGEKITRNKLAELLRKSFANFMGSSDRSVWAVEI